MVRVKELQQSKANYEASASIVTERYKAGVQNADWHTNASSSSAESNYASAVQTAVSEKRRQKAIAKMGNADWQTPALTKGASNISQGMRQASGKWALKFQPFREAMEGVSLPARTTDPMANIDNRAKPIVQALVNKKKQLLG